MRSALVEPGMPGGLPAMMTTRSPSSTRPIAEQLLVDLAHHLVGVLDGVGLEGLDAPGQRELRAHPRVGGEGEHRDLAAVARQPARGVAALGERDEVLRTDPVGHLGRRLRDHAAAGAWLPVDGGHVVQLVVLGRAR